MSDRNDDTADDRLRGIALGAVYEHEAGVTAAETDAALQAVRTRIAAGDPGTNVTRIGAAGARRPKPWILVGAAAAVVAMIAAGLVVVLGGNDDDTVRTATLPPVVTDDPVDTNAPDTMPETTDATTVPTTSVPVTTPPSTSPGRQTFVVDAANPPPLLQPEPIAALPLAPNPNGNRIHVAIGPDSIGVVQPDTGALSLVSTGADRGSVRTVAIEERLSQLVIGPSDVAYGFGEVIIPEPGEQMPGPLPIVAVPLTGDRQGQVVAHELLDTIRWLELPAAVLGNGPDGIIARSRRPNETLITYVDTNGDPSGWQGEVPPLVETMRGDGRDVTVSVVDGPSWNLSITVDPANVGTYVGPTAAASTSEDRVVYWDRIGADTTPDQDFGNNLMPVVAVLDPDGSGEWFRLPDDWDVVASDVWGTVLARTTTDGFEVALLDDVLPRGERSDGADVLAIADNCVGDFSCTQLANTEDGRLVAYDPTDDVLRVFDAAGQIAQREVSLAEPLANQLPSLVHVGPDDVAYFTVQSPDTSDPVRDLLAITLVGPTAGTEVVRYGGLDGSGDSTLVAQKDGLVSVGCCGPAVPRPAPDAPLYHYVDGGGDRIASTAPTFRLDLGDAGSNLARINEDGSSTFFALPTVLQQPRDMPRLVAADDGGAIASEFAYIGDRQYSVFVDFDLDWPEFGIDNADVYFVVDDAGLSPVLLEPAGTVVVRDGRGSFLRRTLDEIATAGWPGDVEINTSTGNVAAPGLNDHIAEQQPSWAADPNLFGVQFDQSIGPNESVQVDADGDVVTITTSGFLDDSVAASRIVVQTEVGPGGLLRFVSATYGWRCQTGRGHQDFSNELCV